MPINLQSVCENKPATRGFPQSPRRRASSNSRRIGPASLLIGMATVAGVFTSSLPAKAHQVFFNAPNVLGGIRNVPITLPSTGVTSLYDIILRKGTLQSIYGSPPSIDLDNATDAQVLMQRSADAINAYASANTGVPFFYEPNIETFFLPYGSPFQDQGSGVQLVNVSASDSVPTTGPGSIPTHKRVTVSFRQVPTQEGGSVWADLQPVPGPLPVAGGLVGWRWARRLRRRTTMATKPSCGK